MIIFVACTICLLIIPLKRGDAVIGHTQFWVRVVNVYYQPIANAQVLARDTRNGDYYVLSFRGWGYYNDALTPGTYDVLVNGRVLKRGVYASAFWYVIVTCYI